MLARITLTSLTGPPAYVALAALVGAESAGVPVPGETALLTAAVLAHQGHLYLPLVIGTAAVAAIVGDNVGFLLGRRGGRWVLERPGPLRSHRAKLLERGDRFFARHGAKAVFLARVFPGVRVTGAWMAGINRMRWRTFLAYNALGASSGRQSSDFSATSSEQPPGVFCARRDSSDWRSSGRSLCSPGDGG